MIFWSIQNYHSTCNKYLAALQSLMNILPLVLQIKKEAVNSIIRRIGSHKSGFLDTQKLKLKNQTSQRNQVWKKTSLTPKSYDGRPKNFHKNQIDKCLKTKHTRHQLGSKIVKILYKTLLQENRDYYKPWKKRSEIAEFVNRTM